MLQDVPRRPSLLEDILRNQRERRKLGVAPSASSIEKQSPPAKDLFSVFAVPDPPPALRPNAYPLAAYEQYRDILDAITEDAKFQKKYTAKPVPDDVAQTVVDWLRDDAPAAECELPLLQAALQEGLEPLSRRLEDSDHGNDDENEKKAVKKTFEKQVMDQRQRFMALHNFTLLHFSTASGCLLQVTNMLARNGNGAPAEIVWQKAKEAGISYGRLLHNLLYVSATFPMGTRASRAKRKSRYGHLTGLVSILDSLDDDDDEVEDSAENAPMMVDLVDEIAIYHDLLHSPTEQSINVRVKLLVAQGNAEQAESLLDQHKSGKADLRLRGYLPVLRLYLELGQSGHAIRLLHKMRNLGTVHVDAETYVYLLEGLTQHGVFCPDAAPLEGIAEVGYAAMSGPGLFDEIAKEMSSEFISISEGAAKRLRNSFARGFPTAGLEEMNTMAPLPLAEQKGAPDELYADQVRIDSATGQCPKSGLKLRLIELSGEMKTKLAERLIGLANPTHAKFLEKFAKKHKGPIRRTVSPEDHLSSFYEWLNGRVGEPFTTIVDGANVAYYHQNFVDGRFNYHQLEFVMDALHNLGENPLIVLPSKYGKKSFYISQSASTSSAAYTQHLDDKELTIRDRLVKENRVYWVPTGFLDDFYWIIASLAPQTTARDGTDLTVPPGDNNGRWPGTRPVLITNDQMRDHQVEMLEPMLFRRWFSNNIVNYNFAAFVDGKSATDTIGFCPADFFSREIQGNKDENSSSTVWHFPLEGKDDEWFCIKIPAQSAVSP